VAILTIIAGGQMIDGFTGGRYTVVTFETTINHACMIKRADCPRRCHMARGAFIRRADMNERLARGVQTVMAGLARLSCQSVIEFGNMPRSDQMAVFTFFSGFDVVIIFPSRNLAIMTTKAARIDLRVIDMHLHPICVVMTVGAIIVGLRVINPLALGLIAVVASRAYSGHALEHTAFMAGFARNGLVGTFKGKSGPRMVKVLVNLDSCGLSLSYCRHGHKPKARDENRDDLQQHM